MTDESNGESTFEFVDKKVDDLSISGDAGKTDSISSLSSSASLLTPLGVSTSTGNLLSNIAPPLALPSFVVNPMPRSSELLVAQERSAQDAYTSNEPVQKQPQANTGIKTTQPQEGEASDARAPEQSTDDASDEDYGVIGGSLFSWMKETVANSNVFSKVAEKAKSSVNSVFTTLDPQMREFIYSGGDINIIVASNKEVKVSPVREAFQSVFGKATVTGVAVETSAVADQPVGFAAGIKGAEERVNAARQLPNVENDIPIVAVENFLLEVEDKWYDLGVIFLSDPKNNVNLHTFTQMTQVPSEIVAKAREATPQDYPLKESGLSVTVGNLMGIYLEVSHNEWHHDFTGVSRRDIILLATQSLVGIYKNMINPL